MPNMAITTFVHFSLAYEVIMMGTTNISQMGCIFLSRNASRHCARGTSECRKIQGIANTELRKVGIYFSRIDGLAPEHGIHISCGHALVIQI